MGTKLEGIIQKYKYAKLIKKEFGFNYINIFMYHFFKKNKSLTVIFKDQSFKMEFFKIASLSKLLNEGWQIRSVNNDYIKMFNVEDRSMITCRMQIPNDILQLVELWIAKIYGSEFEGKNVIDVGASKGDSSIFFCKKGAKRVIAFEPDQSSYVWL